LQELKNAHALCLQPLTSLAASLSLSPPLPSRFTRSCRPLSANWPAISAWYPPVGLSLLLVIGLGVEAIPAIVIAGYLAGIINYQETFTSLPFLLINLWCPPSMPPPVSRFANNSRQIIAFIPSIRYSACSAFH
jgi:hypothetical protein